MKLNKILLIRTDAIGDYILFRNFLDQIKTTPQLQNSYIILLGNGLWKDIAITYDSAWVDEFVWVNMNKYSNSRIYRIFTHFRLHLLKVDVLICAVRTRRKYFEDEFVRRIKAPIKIGSIHEDVSSENTLFTSLIYSPEISEFEWNKSFLEQAFRISFNISETFIKKIVTTNSNKILIFPSASEQHKTWNVNNFTEICSFLVNEMKEEIILCGNDTAISQKIIKSLNHVKLKDTTGTTTLTELILLIASSKLIICNDSAALHIAAALQKKVICMYKGDYYGRFLPYTNKDIKTVLHPDLENFTCDQLLEKYNKTISPLNIEDIGVNRVKEAIVKYL